MNLWNETKSIPISKAMIWLAYKRVRANKGSAGVDAISMEQFDARLSNNLYKLWNRMTSGSYFLAPVKEVEIPKNDGKVRKLGIPAISDRIGQMVIKMYLEPRLEQVFSPNSFGYRPNKSAHQALEQVRKNCWKTDWVIDLDIKGFFYNINHTKLMLAIEKHVPENWVKLYIKRWLSCPIMTKSGKLISKQGKGTPQGGVISPLLANLFLHYGLDKWLEQTDATVKFTRYADDVILHCKSQSHAEQMLGAIKNRMQNIGLELHPQKTKIVYCKDYRRREKYHNVKFDFLGYSFQPRTSKSKKRRGLFLGFDCAISICSRKQIADKLGEIKVHRMTANSIVGIAKILNPMIRGWINYYGKFRKSMLHGVFKLLNNRIVRWARKRYKRYKTSIKRAYTWFFRIQEQFPTLFYHWKMGYTN
ncbi:group II intron reverse transcriptase/maturase [Aquimarina sp. RZ0]|uniref:group II intron reverse transcriptase/maturase n=1 Tax=Aquimarina sp. RZ0 TaxID=2607730 RepID=UPI0011F24978|nr:group II intron reverse transcriptase/maturase [Aquimarina sp. RZ0]KAA1241033.1 group II intron reverse transcriptase/maturase [Aquimarina sp. RZ0]